jgi:hypothetical protein
MVGWSLLESTAIVQRHKNAPRRTYVKLVIAEFGDGLCVAVGKLVLLGQLVRASGQYQTAQRLWVPNRSSTVVTCGIAGRWLSCMIVGYDGAIALSGLSATGGLAGATDLEFRVEERGDPGTPA